MNTETAEKESVPTKQNGKKNIEKFLIVGDRPLIVLPELVKEIGLEEAIILQQLHYLLREEKNGKIINGKKWVFNTYEGWQEWFSWMHVRTIRRHFTRLEQLGFLESCQPEGVLSRRKYYRLTVGGTANNR